MLLCNFVEQMQLILAIKCEFVVSNTLELSAFARYKLRKCLGPLHRDWIDDWMAPWDCSSGWRQPLILALLALLALLAKL